VSQEEQAKHTVSSEEAIEIVQGFLSQGENEGELSVSLIGDQEAFLDWLGSPECRAMIEQLKQQRT